MTNLLIPGAAALLLAGLLVAEKKESLAGKLLTKPLVSLLFIAAAMSQPHPSPAYYRLLLAGLIFCFGGDVFLAFQQKAMFRAGLISFLLGHVFYTFSFIAVTQTGHWIHLGIPIFAAVGLVVFRWLKPSLGDMKIPVAVYIVVITVMMAGASAVASNNVLSGTGRMLVFFGALLFFISDLFVARNRFVKQMFVNRLAGLPLYYAGQFLLAYSVRFIEY